MNTTVENPYLDYVLGPDLPPHPPQRQCPVKRADAVPDGEIRYLWKPYILRGDVTILAAAGGTGKTFALCGIAAELTRGRLPLNPFENPVRLRRKTERAGQTDRAAQFVDRADRLDPRVVFSDPGPGKERRLAQIPPAGIDPNLFRRRGGVFF